MKRIIISEENINIDLFFKDEMDWNGIYRLYGNKSNNSPIYAVIIADDNKFENL